jgi:hypothetical protein
MRYRLLFYDRRHHLVSRFEFWAPNDAQAEGAARELTDAPQQELWCGQRVVRSWSVQPTAST